VARAWFKNHSRRIVPGRSCESPPTTMIEGDTGIVVVPIEPRFYFMLYAVTFLFKN
jgi:hypothetical protein